MNYPVFIYALFDPRDGVTKYVGQTTSLPARLAAHRNRTATSNPGLSAWVAQLHRDGVQIEAEILESIPDPGAGEPLRREREWILRKREAGCALFNVLNGGVVAPSYTQNASAYGKCGMEEAARRLGVHVESAKRTLRNLGIEPTRINRNTLVVSKTDLERAVILRTERGVTGRGRPRRVSNGGPGGALSTEGSVED